MGKETKDDVQPPAGWYDDPGSEYLLCYWDGEKFTDKFKAKDHLGNTKGPNSTSVFAFSFGLAACLIVFTPFYGLSFLFAIPGLVLGIVGLAKRKKPFWMSLSGVIAASVGWVPIIVFAIAFALMALASSVR